MTLLFLMVPLMGATAADGCSSTPSKACNVASCTSGQVLVCGKLCVTPLPVGSACSLDLCSASGTCAEGATCVPTGVGNQGLCTKLPSVGGDPGNTTTVGVACSTQADCCGASAGNPMVCATSASGNKVCAVCKKAGVACTNSDQCCKGGSCTDGFCRVPCTAGGSCSTSQKGACKAGHYECDAYGNLSCVSNQSPTSNDATCDGIDNDCDGNVDEEVPNPMGSCTKTLTAAECGYPTSFAATGQLVCKNGTQVCEIKAGVSYCTAASGGPCGGAYGEPCDAQKKCGIGLVCTTTQNGPRCLQIQNPSCPPNTPNVSCWPLNSPYLGQCLP